MKNRVKKVIINGVYFELCSLPNVERITYSGACWDEINRVYSKPSRVKIDIWHDWCNWAYQIKDNGGKCAIWIEGVTCNFFTIRGWCIIDGRKYMLYITAAHNRACAVTE